MTYISGLVNTITVAPTYAELANFYAGLDNTNTGNSEKVSGQNLYKLLQHALPITYEGGDPNNTITADSVAVGIDNTASNDFSIVVGRSCTAAGEFSTVMGYNAKTTIDNTIEVGYWISSTVRSSAIRLNQTGQVSFTFVDSATAPTDGGATAGSEADGTLGRGMLSFRINGTEVWVDVNVAGTVTSTQLNLGV